MSFLPFPNLCSIDPVLPFTAPTRSIDEAALAVILRELRITAKQISNGLRSSKRRLRDMERMVSRGREPVDYVSVKGGVAALDKRLKEIRRAISQVEAVVRGCAA